MDRLDGIITDLKESIDDFGNELKISIDKCQKLEEKILKLEKKLEEIKKAKM